MPVERDAWDGAITQRAEHVEVVLDTVLGPVGAGGSQPFAALDTAKARWYVKAPNNPQGSAVPVTEYVVSRAGQLIGAPVCVVEPVQVPDEFAGHQLQTGLMLEAGVGSASQEVAGVIEGRGAPEHRARDDNARRHAGAFAMFDWCWGGDPQYLYAEPDDAKLYSHDHGWYFPPEGPTWDWAAIEAHQDVGHPIPADPAGLDKDELTRLADALDNVTHDVLLEILESVPAAWPVPNADLEALGFFLERRAPAVAQRLREIRDTL